MSAHTEFDLGSLVWVKSEIEQTLQKAAQALAQFGETNDSALLKHARTFLHQAHGAVQMVELTGLARFCEEIEQALVFDELSADALEVIQRGIAEASHYLEQLSAGAPNQPLRLLSSFKKMAALRQTTESGAELFFPQLSELVLPLGLPVKNLPAADMSGFIRLRRQRFEAGLLNWISKDVGAASIMAKSLAEIAATQPNVVSRHFWWAAAGLLDGLSSHRASADIDFKTLILRLNLQLRRLSDGSGKVAERLYRDILYALLIIETTSPLALGLRKAFALESLLPSKDADLLSPAAVLRKQLARSLREDLAVCKDTWSRICSGQSERLVAFLADFEPLAVRSAPLSIPGLDDLWQALHQAIHRLNRLAPSDGQALEVATALLLIDNGLAIYPLLADDFPAQVDAMSQRLLNPSLNSEVPHLDAVSRQAQERLLQAQLAHEMRSNLQMVEDVLEGWFRNPDHNSELVKVEPSLRQIQGALQMLDKHQAVELLQLCQKRIEQFVRSELLLPAQEELELLAEGLSSLGFYLDDIAQSRDEPASLLGMIDKLSGALPVDSLADSLLEVLEEEPELEAITTIVAPQADPSKPLPVSDAAVDAELLEVFLEEAAEVLASIAEQLRICQQTPHDREALTVVRRSFHTLKGSGRMVGLNHLGQVAWAIEQLMNKLMQIERPASAELIDLLDQAHRAFSGWVQQLSTTGAALIEASDLIALVDRIKEQLGEAALAPVEHIHLSVDPEQAENDEVMIGTVTVSASLFALFCNEALQYLSTLQNKNSDPSAYLLAAHTLGGIASTAGFRSLGELAYTLEHVVQQLGEMVIADEPVLEQAVNRIASMLGAIFALEAPGFAEAEILALQKLRAQPFDISLDEEAEVAPLDLDLYEPHSEAAEAPLEASLDLSEGKLEEPAELTTATDALELSLLDSLLAEPFLADEDIEQADDAEAGIAPHIESPVLDGLLATEPSLASESIEQATDAEAGIAPHIESPVLDGLLATEPSLASESIEQAVEVEAGIAPRIESPVLDGSLAIEPSLVDDAEQAQTASANELENIASPLLDGLLDVDSLSGMAIPAELLDEVEEEVEFEQHAALADLLEIDPASLDPLLDKHDLQRKAELDSEQSDDIDEQLLPVFIEEADELIQQISASLRGLRLPEPDEKDARALARVLHTFKGSARMAGAMRMGEVIHQMESRLLAAGSHYSASLLDAFDADFDLIQMLADELKGGKKPEEVIAPVAVQQAEVDTSTTIRVKSELMDQLVNQAGEVSIARSRIEAEMLTMKSSLLDLTENVNRLRSQLREMEIQAESQMQAKVKEHEGHEANFDPLEFDRFTRLQEVTRFIAESVNDVATIQQNLLKNHDDSSSALSQQARMTKELQQSLMRVRMVPFSSLSERLYRLTRQTGKEVGKKVNLELRGGRVEIDRGVLDQMMSPFEHMLRNAIDHGLETTEQRLALGKPEFGEVQVEVRQEGNELVLLLKDDGKGLDLASLRTKGLEKGLINNNASDQMITELIFEPGISTASSLTTLSGRGIGMDVVKNKLGDLGGRIEVSSETGVGTTFTIYLPLTLAVTQVVLVKANGQQYAIPSGMVEQVQEIKLGPLEHIYENRFQEWMDHRYPFAYFPRLLGDTQSVPEQKRYNTVILLRSGSSRMALHVDELLRNQEVVVKAIGPQLARIPGVTGATVLGNGDVVMIMNPLSLLARGETRSTAIHISPEALKTTPVVMIVDDSLTVRKITGRLLAKEGFQVLTAKDGLDALQQLSDIKPDVMLVDIEMPRMDGFEFTRNVRANEGTRHIPIIMITSRTADKHKNYAFELGVNTFLGKPYQEEELLGHIRGFIQA
ncbi:Hpt domain-containing protein [Iodobacter sp. CM08]|uniref:Hpt domain-containing protein n=1 Tax=Iodobacter sp. CM08 TaxID=3085902 RepID=UPI002980A407|nr:Hpt domain-containing protein [Iodobacter sp. CM08]MDW5416283.1 Hpt domain-containing protein [Iodobacter sp. CM08]